MRVLMLSWEYPPVVVGGLGRHVHALATALAAAGNDVLVVARQPGGTDAETHPTELVTDRQAPGVRILRVAEDPPHLEFARDLVAWTLGLGHAMLRHAVAALRTLDWAPDVVHAHDWLVAHAAIALADLVDAPLVATLHATEAGRHGGWLSQPLNQQVHSVEWWLVRRADAVVTCSQAMRTEVSGLFDVDPDAVTVLHNGIDPAVWDQVSAVPVHRPVSSAGEVTAGAPPTLVYAGRLEWEKGVHDLVAALPAIRRAHPGTRLLVAGTGSCTDWLADRARAARVRRAVILLGQVDDAALADLLASASAVVLPSRYEPFGIVALEAAAAGAPLVASRAGGLAEIVVDGVTGLAFDPGDVGSLAAAAVAALDDPAAARRRAETARARLDTDFAWPAIAADTAALYGSVVRRGPAALGRPKIPTGNVFGL